MNCKHCFCIPFKHGNHFLELPKQDYQCCKCGKDKYGLTKTEKKQLKEALKKGFKEIKFKEA